MTFQDGQNLVCATYVRLFNLWIATSLFRSSTHSAFLQKLFRSLNSAQLSISLSKTTDRLEQLSDDHFHDRELENYRKRLTLFDLDTTKYKELKLTKIIFYINHLFLIKPLRTFHKNLYQLTKKSFVRSQCKTRRLLF